MPIGYRISALKYTSFIGSKIIGIVGRDGGYTAKVGDICLIIPTVNSDTITPHSETFQAIIWHLLVSHPKLKVAKNLPNFSFYLPFSLPGCQLFQHLY